MRSGTISPVAFLAAAVVVVLGAMTSYVVLALADHETAGLISFVTPVLTILLAGQVQGVSKDQNAKHEQTLALVENTRETVEQVQRQTNGELTTRIRELVREAITEAYEQTGVKANVLPSRRATDRPANDRPTIPRVEGAQQ